MEISIMVMKVLHTTKKFQLISVLQALQFKVTRVQSMRIDPYQGRSITSVMQPTNGETIANQNLMNIPKS